MFHTMTYSTATFTNMQDNDFIGRVSATGRVVDFHMVTEAEG